MNIDMNLNISQLQDKIQLVFDSACEKTYQLHQRWDEHWGAPTYTTAGRYTTRAWTQWTQGFFIGNALLIFDVTGDKRLLEIGRKKTSSEMLNHLTNIGVHDHAFNNLSTFGQLRRLMLEGKIEFSQAELDFYNLAIRVSGAVQASRWTELKQNTLNTEFGSRQEKLGYIYSFNGPHSLFIDTIRTIRICMAAHLLGQKLYSEQDQSVNLLARSFKHAETSSLYNIYFGNRRDQYDTPGKRGRTVHETIFNLNSKEFRCPNSQQGYSPFSTWTRGLAWAILGFAEEYELAIMLPESEFGKEELPSKNEVLALYVGAAKATADFYINEASAADGICYWDTGAPMLYKLDNWQETNADPFNDYEPVDSSASVIAAQGLIRLGRALDNPKYFQAGLSIARRLFSKPYFSNDPNHEGLLLHSVYHRPNGWDHISPGNKIPCGESSMWGDYHYLELALLLHRIAKGQYYMFFDPTFNTLLSGGGGEEGAKNGRLFFRGKQFIK